MHVLTWTKVLIRMPPKNEGKGKATEPERSTQTEGEASGSISATKPKEIHDQPAQVNDIFLDNIPAAQRSEYVVGGKCPDCGIGIVDEGYFVDPPAPTWDNSGCPHWTNWNKLRREWNKCQVQEGQIREVFLKRPTRWYCCGSACEDGGEPVFECPENRGVSERNTKYKTCDHTWCRYCIPSTSPQKLVLLGEELLEGDDTRSKMTQTRRDQW